MSEKLRGTTYDFADEYERLVEELETLSMVSEEFSHISDVIGKMFSDFAGTKVDDSLKLAAIFFRYRELETKIKMVSKLMDYSLNDIYEVVGKTETIKDIYWKEHVGKEDK